MDLRNEYPRVLIISNNPLSETSNNGKTLASFFDEYPSEKIGQLYFSSEIPSSKNCNNYFRITDNDILKKILFNKLNVGEKVNSHYNPSKLNNKFKNNAKNSNIVRLLREAFWKIGKWKNNNLSDWLDNFSPEIIFFCAGDSLFAYDITKYIQNQYSSKLVLYITDDYILPRKTLNIFWWLRRNFVLNKMREAILKSDLFLTISDNMKECYKNIFHKNSTLAINMVDSLKDDGIKKESEVTTLVYAGGLHYKRYKTLYMLSKVIKKYNEDTTNKKKVFLKIYSTQYISKNKERYLNIKNSSGFYGGVNSLDLKEILNKCDIPVHVESFDKKSIESTKLSISTKIPEYLSLNKPILAIGPENIASMQYIKQSAYCITSPSKLYTNFKVFIEDVNLQKKLSERALENYNRNHNKKNVSKAFINELLNLID